MKKILAAVLVCSIASASLLSCKKEKAAVNCSTASEKAIAAWQAYQTTSTPENCNKFKTEWTSFANSSCFSSFGAEQKQMMQSVIDGLGDCNPR